MCSRTSTTRRWATAASAGWPPASSIRPRRWTCRSTATACATNTACSSRRFQDGFQNEAADDWQRLGDPWSRRRDTHEVTVTFADQTVRAIPYDMPVIGYGTRNIGTLRLWESAPLTEFDFKLFNDQEYALAVQEKNTVEDITRVLYPNDSTPAGKKLRLKQQYFLSSASLQDILFRFKREGWPITEFAKHVTIQLNDTHPTVSIPELIRLLMREGLGL